MAINRTSFHETEEYKVGDTSQRYCADFFKKRGWFFIASYDFHDGDKHAPRMEGDSESYILPDLDVSKEAVRRWVEVKYKSHATYHRLTQTLEHGLELRLVNHYLNVERITGCELWLAVHEAATGILMAAKMSDLAECRRDWVPKPGKDNITKRFGRVMSFFPRSRFQYFTRLTQASVPPHILYIREIVRRSPQTALADVANVAIFKPNGRQVEAREKEEYVRTMLAALNELRRFGGGL